MLVARDMVPPKVGLASLGGLPLVTWTPREVLVTHLPAYEMGTKAAKMLLERIEGLEDAGRRVVLPVEVTDDQAGLSIFARKDSPTS